MSEMRWIAVLAAAVLAGCTPTPPSDPVRGNESSPMPGGPPQSEFAASHHAVVEGVVTARGGQALDSVTVVAWRLATGRGSVLQTNAVTDAAGRFRLPLEVHVGPEPTPLPVRVVIRGFAYASRYPRGPEGSVALDSVTLPVTLVPLSQTPPVVRATLILPLP